MLVEGRDAMANKCLEKILPLKRLVGNGLLIYQWKQRAATFGARSYLSKLRCADQRLPKFDFHALSRSSSGNSGNSTTDFSPPFPQKVSPRSILLCCCRRSSHFSSLVLSESLVPILLYCMGALRKNGIDEGIVNYCYCIPLSSSSFMLNFMLEAQEMKNLV